MGELRRRIAALSPRMILVFGWCLFVVHAYPGLMAADSFVQLADARRGAFADPALMPALWWVFDRVIAGPFLMLALQSLAFIAGAYLVARRLVQPRAAAVCAVVVLLLPPVIAGMAVVSAHALLAGIVLLGAGLLLEDRRAGYVLAGIGVLGLAAGIRYHAAFATLPVMVMGLARWRTGPKGWQRHGVALLLWLAMTAMGLLITDWLPHHGPVVTGFPDDVTGTFAGVLGLGSDQPIVTRESQAIELLRAAEIQQAHGWLQGATSRVVGALSHTLVFRPWLYLVLAFALLVKSRQILELRVLLASGIALELSLVYHATDADWRESHWLIACTLLAAAIVIARRFRPSTIAAVAAGADQSAPSAQLTPPTTCATNAGSLQRSPGWPSAE